MVVVVGMFFVIGIGLASTQQQTLGTFKQGDCIPLSQTCGNCTYNNITTVLKTGENSIVHNISSQMTKTGTFYNYTFCNTSQTGIYNVHGFGDINGIVTSWIYNFEITGTGFEFSQPRAILSLGLIGLLIFLFIITLGGISKLPSKDNYDEEGTLLSINQLKYLRPVLAMVSFFLIIAIVYVGSNIAFAYMGTTLLAEILFAVFKILFGLSLPIVVVWFCYIFYSIFKDREMKKYLERGVM